MLLIRYTFHCFKQPIRLRSQFEYVALIHPLIMQHNVCNTIRVCMVYVYVSVLYVSVYVCIYETVRMCVSCRSTE